METVVPGLRERKKRALRARLSSTATAMFAEHGFDEVRVSDIAKACGVTPKTLYSYFPTKESLLLERGDTLAAALDVDHDGSAGLLEAVLDAIRQEIDQLAASSPAATTGDDLVRGVRGFIGLVEATPALRALVAERAEALTSSAAEAFSRLNALPPTAADNQVAAAAIMSLWRIHISGLLQHGATSRDLTELRQRTMADVERGADLISPIVEQVGAVRSATPINFRR